MPMSSSGFDLPLSEEHLPEGLRHFTKPLVWTDADGRIAAWNLSAGAEFPNLRRGELLSEALCPSAETAAQKLSDQQYLTVQSLSGAPDRVFQLHCTGWDGHEGGQQCLLIDQTQTQRKLAAMELQLGALERSKSDLERMGSLAIHELQEPLRTMTSFSALLLKRHADQLPPEARKLLGMVHEAAGHIDTVFRRMSQYIRYLRGIYLRKPLDLKDICENARLELHGELLARNARCDVGALPTVLGEATSLQRALVELIDNALKFCPADRAPHIQIRAEDLRGHWRISISDNGIGLRKEHRHQVFQLLRRIHSRDIYPGAGVGLALTNRVIQAHGGSCDLSDSPLGGLTVSFTLPRA